jgi:hypothetical protein
MTLIVYVSDTERGAGLTPHVRRLELGRANPAAPLCVECRRPAHISVDGEDLCELCIALMRRKLEIARLRVTELDEHLARHNLPRP